MERDDRLFQRIFKDMTVHVAELDRVHSESWWDGRHLLFQVTTQRRNRSEHEWPEAESTTTLHEIGYSSAAAIRRAIALHDEAVKRAFVEADAACVATG